MSTAALDPVIHHPRRLRILAALATLPDGDTILITRLRDLIGLPQGSPISHVCELSGWPGACGCRWPAYDLGRKAGIKTGAR